MVNTDKYFFPVNISTQFSLVQLVPFISVSFSSVTQSRPALCDLMDYSTPGFPVHHQLPELAQTRVHWVGDAIQHSGPYLEIRSLQMCLVEMSPFWIKWALTLEFSQVTHGVEGDKTHREDSMWPWRQRLGFAALSQRMPTVTSGHQKLRKRQGADPSPGPTRRSQPSDTLHCELLASWAVREWTSVIEAILSVAICYISRRKWIDHPWRDKFSPGAGWTLGVQCSKAVCPFDLWQLSWQWRIRGHCWHGHPSPL